MEKPEVENRAWKVDVFTDGNGRKIYTVEIEAAYEGEAIALAKAEVALPLAILNPLTKVVGARATLKHPPDDA